MPFALRLPRMLCTAFLFGFTYGLKDSDVHKIPNEVADQYVASNTRVTGTGQPLAFVEAIQTPRLPTESNRSGPVPPQLLRRDRPDPGIPIGGGMSFDNIVDGYDEKIDDVTNSLNKDMAHMSVYHGPNGRQGPRGPAGHRGLPGVYGPPGPPGSDYEGNMFAIERGGIGPPGPIGYLGDNGPAGPVGPAGVQGKMGGADQFPEEEKERLRGLFQSIDSATAKAEQLDKIEHNILGARFRLLKDHFSSMEVSLFKLEEAKRVVKATWGNLTKAAEDESIEVNRTKDSLGGVIDAQKRLEGEQTELREHLIHDAQGLSAANSPQQEPDDEYPGDKQK